SFSPYRCVGQHGWRLGGCPGRRALRNRCGGGGGGQSQIFRRQRRSAGLSRGSAGTCLGGESGSVTLSFAKNTSDRSPSDIRVLAMEQIGLRGHKELHARNVTGRSNVAWPQVFDLQILQTESPEQLETRTFIVRRIFDEGQVHAATSQPNKIGPA